MKIIGIIFAIVAFMLLVVAHEGGHMLLAKLCGIRVNEFSVGMGPLIFKKDTEETQYSIRAIPVGGYCKLEGDGEESDDPRALNNASWLNKMLIFAAGPVCNILLCIIILFFVFLYAGSYSRILDKVTAGSPADLAGLRAGDEVLAVDDRDVGSWSEFVSVMSVAEGETKVDFLRDGKEQTVILVPEYDDELGRNLIGVQCRVIHSAGDSVRSAFETSSDYFSSLGEFFVRLFRGNVQSDDVVGVVGIVSVVSEEAQYGLINVIYFMAIISLNLGAVNLVPFPALDGGRMLITTIKAISRGRLSDRAEAAINSAGMIVLMALMIFLIFKDTIGLIF